MNPEVNQEIQELKKELKELKQLVKALTSVTDEGGTINADSLVIKMLKLKINKK
jgi:cell shape-determining protein MreC